MSEYKTLQELFADEDRWIKNIYALDKEGDLVFDAEHKDAICWCLIGGVVKVYGPYEKDEAKKVFKKIKEYVKNNSGLHAISITHWNDSPKRTIEDIQKLCRELDI